MATKMSIEDIDRLIKMQNRATKLFEEQDALYQELFDKYGEVLDCVPHADKDYPFIKISIEDNVAKLKKGEDVWKSTKFSRFSVTTKPLKKMSKLVSED